MRPLIALVLAAWSLAAPASADEVTVFAAASLKTALDEVAADFETESGHEMRLSYAGSSALARQIRHGAPADVFISASPEWMDALDEDELIAAGTRADLLSNRLVLIAADDIGEVEVESGLDLRSMLGDERLAVALVEAVPAGIYARAALGSLGLWDSVADRVAQADNVRAALALVAIDAAPFGIVYATDALAEPRVHVAGVFPEESHPRIVYPAAAIDGAGEAARAFLDDLRGAAASSVFRRHGFIVLDAPADK